MIGQTALVIAVAFVALAALAGYCIHRLEQGRQKLLEAVLARSAQEYLVVQAAHDKKLDPPEALQHPLMDDALEALLAERRSDLERAWLQEVTE